MRGSRNTSGELKSSFVIHPEQLDSYPMGLSNTAWKIPPILERSCGFTKFPNGEPVGATITVFQAPDGIWGLL